MRTDSSTRLQLNLHKWVFTVLLLCALFMLGWLSQQYHQQLDMTANQRNSLSSGSIELLRSLQGEVMINIYARDDDPALVAAIQEIMERYARIKQDFSYRTINPDLDFETAESQGINRYGEIIVRYNGRQESINSLSEQAISGALLRMSRDSTRTVVFLAGHGERNPKATDNKGYSKLAAELEANGLQVSRQHLLQGGIPETTDLLVIGGLVKAISDGEREHIDNYLDNGGNLLWMMDPGELHGMQSLAQMLGIGFHDGMVVDNNIELRRTLQIQHPAIIPVLEFYPHAVTKGVNYNALFPLARGIDLVQQDSNSDWQHSVLWRSFERSWSETGSLSEDIVFSTDDGDIAGPIPLAVAIDRTLAGESEDKASQRIIVIGDTDFLSNAYIGVGANLALANNVFNWLSGDDDLIAVDIKHANDLQLQLSDTQVLLLFVVYLLLLPASLIVIGTAIWLRRRKR